MPGDGTALFLRQPVQYQDTGAERIAYRTVGRGAPLLFLHGWPLSAFTFRHLLPALVDHFTCYLLDLPGAGASQWTEATDFSIEGRARIVHTFAARVGLRHYAVVGQDTGATVGRRLAVMAGGRITKVILLNTEMPGHRPPWIPLYRLLLFLPGSHFIFRQLVRSRPFVRSPLGFGGCFVNRDLLGHDFEDHVIRPLVASPRRMLGQSLVLRGIDWSEVDALVATHRAMSMPTLLIWGEDDPTFPVERARQMVAQFPSATLLGIPRAKLLVHEEQPDLVSAAIKEFLTRP